MNLTNIVVNLRMPGIHRWETCTIPEMSFLKDYHRHMFHIRCEKQVFHNDRDVEIIMFKKSIQDFMREKYSGKDDIFFTQTGDDCLFFDYRSCEHIAHEIVEHFDLSLCEVLEDGENGAIVYKSILD